MIVEYYYHHNDDESYRFYKYILENGMYGYPKHISECKMGMLCGKIVDYNCDCIYFTEVYTDGNNYKYDLCDEFDIISTVY